MDIAKRTRTPSKKRINKIRHQESTTQRQEGNKEQTHAKQHKANMA